MTVSFQLTRSQDSTGMFSPSDLCQSRLDRHVTDHSQLAGECADLVRRGIHDQGDDVQVSLRVRETHSAENNVTELGQHTVDLRCASRPFFHDNRHYSYRVLLHLSLLFRGTPRSCLFRGTPRSCLEI